MNEFGNITIIEADSRFKKVDKGLIENPNIDCLTLGIYTKLIVLGKKWQLNVKGLRKPLGLSDDKVRKSLSLLEQEGYILRTPARNAKGQLVGWNYTIYPTPINEKNRSQAGLKNDDNRPHETPSTPKSDHAANGGLLNNRLNQQLDLKDLEVERDKSLSEKENKKNIDFLDIQRKWEELNPNLPTIRGFSEKRKKALRTLLSNNNATVEDLYKAFEIVSACSFCQGNNDRKWVATLDWLLNDTKGCFNRLLEGAYAFNQREKQLVSQIMGGEGAKLQTSDKLIINGVEYK